MKSEHLAEIERRWVTDKATNTDVAHLCRRVRELEAGLKAACDGWDTEIRSSDDTYPSIQEAVRVLDARRDALAKCRRVLNVEDDSEEVST